jgi:hypothetical protein
MFHFALIRFAIPAREKLAATLRILATGESFQSIHYQFRHGYTTVQRYFPEVCRAIYNVLRNDYMTVSWPTIKNYSIPLIIVILITLYEIQSFN